MAGGWDVLLSGERSAWGRMGLGGGRSVRGVIRQDVDQGVRVTCEVVGEGPQGSTQLLEDALQDRRRACEVQGALRSVEDFPPQIAVGG